MCPSAALPGRHVLYPGTHREAVGSRDCCSEPGSFAPLHERPPGVELKSYMQSIFTLKRCNSGAVQIVTMSNASATHLSKTLRSYHL